MNSKTVCIVLNEELKNQAQELAKKKNISLNAIVRLALSELIERNK